MKASQLREMTPEELQSTLDDTHKEFFNLRLQQSLGQLEKPSRLVQVRKQVSRILTLQAEHTKQKSEVTVKYAMAW
jgi:large subunit ribosomal protein L29